MHRTNIYLTDEQRANLADRAASAGVTVAELVRRFIDAGLTAASEDLAGDLDAIDASFAILDGVDLDRADGARGAHLERLVRR